MQTDRRSFARGMAALAFGGLAASCARPLSMAAADGAAVLPGYGPLVEDPGGLLDLPRGFSYRLISSLGDAMSDGNKVPDRADGMGCFRLDANRIALVRNHELGAHHAATGPFAGGSASSSVASFDRVSASGQPMPGGTSTIVLDARTLAVESQYLSLVGTIRNCAGGITPWGSWLTCEEDVTRAGAGRAPGTRDHGWVFEVPAAAGRLVDPVPLTAMGRRNHEAACVDPRTGIVYLTEDRNDSLFYRFLPEAPGRLSAGGRLQALAFIDTARTDTRNWNGADMAPGEEVGVRWIDLDGVEAPDDDLRDRGHAAGAALFARGEGIWWGNGELYFTATSGGRVKESQVFRYIPSRAEGQAGERDAPGKLKLFLESPGRDTLSYADNLTVMPNGHLMLCEDQYEVGAVNHLRGVTPAGDVYPFARIRLSTEPAGVCFSPDGLTMFVNLYSPTRTLAITGPWA
ncbi:MAG: PhoX family protein [Sphingopyxis sp.]|nr:PhoX family protein [Sphingopyxis sp.]